MKVLQQQQQEAMRILVGRLVVVELDSRGSRKLGGWGVGEFGSWGVRVSEE